jgi:hypothetical protein
MYKCAKGLVFDETTQRCIWGLPWQTCQDLVTSPTTTTLETTAVTLTSMTSQLEDSFESITSTKQTSIIDNENSSREDDGIESSSLRSRNDKNSRQSRQSHSISHVIYENKQYEDSTNDDFNVTIDNSYNPYEEEESEENDERYAYVIVPIKVSKNKKVTEILKKTDKPVLPTSLSKNKNKPLRKAKNMTRNFQGMS